MKVLHLLKTSVGARWALLQLRELTRLGVECHVVLPDGGGFAPQYISAGVTVHELNLNAAPLTPGFFQRASALAALVARIDPDVVHSHFVATTLLMRFALRGRRPLRVFQVAGPLHLENAALARVEVATGRSGDFWIASCEWTRQRYRALGVAAKRVFLSHYGSDLDDCRATAASVLRAELGLPSSTALVGMVAYCYKPKRYLGARRGIKGHEDFIDAVGMLRRRAVDVVGVIAGGAWKGAERYYEDVQAYARSNADARVIFLGTRRDIASVYAALDVAVHPSLSENLGGAAESLLFGVPTVTTNIGGFPDLIREGSTGRMVAPRSPAQLADAIGNLLADPTAAAAMAAEGRRYARELLDVRRTAAQIAAIYRDIAGSRPVVEGRGAAVAFGLQR